MTCIVSEKLITIDIVIEHDIWNIFQHFVRILLLSISNFSQYILTQNVENLFHDPKALHIKYMSLNRLQLFRK
eukprot:UN15470